jgi:RNA polymerase sigma-70 factor (ECF subfamily)
MPSSIPPGTTLEEAREDARLVEQCRVGTDDVARVAFETLYARHYASAVRFAYRFVRVRDRAEDLAQEVFALLWHRRATLEVRGTFRTYVLSAVRFEALDAMRHDRVMLRSAEALEGSAEPPAGMGAHLASPDDAAHEALLREAMRQAVDALPERQRTALILRWEQGLDNHEIAAVLEIGAAAVSRLLARAVNTLRAVM